LHLSQQMKALGDPIRLRLFALLGQHDELCVCHLVDTLSLPQSTISRHLSVLRHAGLVDTRREGKWMYYRIHPKAKALLALVLQYEEPQSLEDKHSLQQVLS